jgi:hypothetical protein
LWHFVGCAEWSGWLHYVRDLQKHSQVHWGHLRGQKEEEHRRDLQADHQDYVLRLVDGMRRVGGEGSTLCRSDAAGRADNALDAAFLALDARFALVRAEQGPAVVVKHVLYADPPPPFPSRDRSPGGRVEGYSWRI